MENKVRYLLRYPDKEYTWLYFMYIDNEQRITSTSAEEKAHIFTTEHELRKSIIKIDSITGQKNKYDIKKI